MNTNSTEIKNEIVNEISNLAERTPLAACNSGGPLKVSESPSLTASAFPPGPQFIKTPEVYSRQGELLTPEHPDYAGILAIITRELSERFQNGETALARYFAPPAPSGGTGQGATGDQGGTGDPPVAAGHRPGASPNSSDPVPQSSSCEATQPISPLKVSPSPSLTVSDLAPTSSPPADPPALAPALELAPAPPGETPPSLPTLDIGPGTLDSTPQSVICEATEPISPLKVSSSPSPTVFDLAAQGEGASELPTRPRRKRKPSHRPRVGKVAKLPPELRTFVNEQILAEVGYPRIIEALGEKGFPGINATNLCKWKDGGFREWVLSQDTVAARNARRAAALSLARDKGFTLEQATVQLALGSVYTVLENLDLVQWQADIGSKNDNVLNLFGGLSTLIKANKTLEPKKRSALNLQADPDSTPRLLKRGLTEEERDQVCRNLGIFPPEPEPNSEPNT